MHSQHLFTSKLTFIRRTCLVLHQAEFQACDSSDGLCMFGPEHPNHQPDHFVDNSHNINTYTMGFQSQGTQQNVRQDKDYETTSQPKQRPILKVFLAGLYDEESHLSKLRGCDNIIKAIWTEVRDYYQSAVTDGTFTLNTYRNSCFIDILHHMEISSHIVLNMRKRETPLLLVKCFTFQ